ncbi:hypothetical protein BX600DRAFT_406167 [Xylariales sp. PMI_506]|nr:hypothetical protein BX600DRAFT_406167 [Xylariales sp. PMI_506]
MFGGLADLIPPATLGPPPKDIPPATPVTFPTCNPQLRDDAQHHPSVVRVLQSIHRPVDLSESHFAALGVHLNRDAPLETLIPDPSFLPPTSEAWDGVTLDQVGTLDADFRRPLSGGGLSPEARVYLERYNELSIDNQAAFRTVRRVRPEPGTRAPRLGNSYEFYKQLEHMAAYWDDTSMPPWAEDEKDQPAGAPAAAESGSSSETKKDAHRVTYRTAPGSTMPPDVRHNLVSAFIKLVSYDFGCNISAPRVEPRLQLVEPPLPGSRAKGAPQEPRASSFPSGCVFLVRTPKARDLARTGVVEGPLAAVSARNTTNFKTPAENNIDLGRELIAALITAQHRAREGREEKRFGDGKWWATAPRWGGGPGGPIGRELEGAGGVLGDKDNHPLDGHPSIYDNYRQVRLPASTWDKKSRYTAIGKVRGGAYDDVFVISSLFHHVSVLRVRVPNRLLDILGGAPESGNEGEERGGGGGGRDWDKLEVWRTKWFDLFIVQDRVEAMRALWGLMAWIMRKSDEEDVSMKEA